MGTTDAISANGRAGDVVGMARLMIGELGRLTSTKVTTIRFYESIGLLRTAARTMSGRRTYEGEDLDRLHFVRNTRRLGFSVEEVRSLMALSDRPGQSCAAAADIAGRHLADVEERLVHLNALRDELATLADGCSNRKTGERRLIQAIASLPRARQ